MMMRKYSEKFRDECRSSVSIHERTTIPAGDDREVFTGVVRVKSLSLYQCKEEHGQDISLEQSE